MKKKTLLLLCLLLGLLALGVTLYPLISNYFGEKNRSLVETRYEKAVEKMDTGERDAARAAASAYNETLLSITGKAFSKETLQQAADSYDSLLNIRGDGIMGYVEIPRIGVELPIFHGTDEATLDRGVGHLLGSSLPVGGIGTHCVLTGHSGLAGQKMFSDLDRLEKGDVFYLKTLDETLAYMVLEINTVLPEDTSKLTIDPNRDSCTLITCTPYGVNTHRLLVRGERVEYETAVSIAEEAEKREDVASSTWTTEYLKGVFAGLAGIVVLALSALLLRWKRRGKKFSQKILCRRKPQKTVYVPRHTAETVERQTLWWEPDRYTRRGKHEKT